MGNRRRRKELENPKKHHQFWILRCLHHINGDTMTRGNQRDKAREKAQKKAAAQNKGPKESGASLEARKFRDAEIMREKQEKKAAAAAGGTAGGSGGAAGGAGKK